MTNWITNGSTSWNSANWRFAIPESKGNIRYYLSSFLNQRLIGISQQDDEEFDPTDPTSAYVELLFENGGTIRFFTVGDDVGPAFATTHGDECNCDFCKEGDTE